MGRPKALVAHPVGDRTLLEHGIALNLVADHHPDAHVSGDA